MFLLTFCSKGTSPTSLLRANAHSKDCAFHMGQGPADNKQPNNSPCTFSCDHILFDFWWCVSAWLKQGSATDVYEGLTTDRDVLLQSVLCWSCSVYHKNAPRYFHQNELKVLLFTMTKSKWKNIYCVNTIFLRTFLSFFVHRRHQYRWHIKSTNIILNGNMYTHFQMGYHP